MQVHTLESIVIIGELFRGQFKSHYDIHYLVIPVRQDIRIIITVSH
jgi:hypothetical protein